MILVDSHCHLNYEPLYTGLDAHIQRANEAGVEYFQTICTKIEEFEQIYSISLAYKNVFCSVGVHPTEPNIVTKDILIEYAQRPKVIGIGETGLDYYHPPHENQVFSFQEHILAGRELDLPIIIHTRDAEEDTLKILQEEMQKGYFRALIHCFTGNRDFAKALIELGLYISIAGVITFKNAQALREAIENIPLNRLLLETDAPFLAPVPYRGKVNEPAYVLSTAQVIADIYQISLNELALATTENFFRLFSKAHRS